MADACQVKDPDRAYGIDHVCGLPWLHRGEHRCRYDGHRWSGEKMPEPAPWTDAEREWADAHNRCDGLTECADQCRTYWLEEARRALSGGA